MTKPATWYYDFVSPYAYLQLQMLDRFDGRLEITHTPVLFAGLLNHWGQLGPAEMAPKRLWTYRICQFMAGEQGVPFRMPPAHPFNPVNVLRLMIVAGNTRAAAKTAFHFVWGEGRNPQDPAEFGALADALGIEDAAARVSDQAVKDQLRANTDGAVAVGVFGVPTLQIDDQLFWGQDGTRFAEAYVADPDMFKAPEWARLDDLPKAAERPR